MEIQKVITMETVIAFIESNLDGKLELDTVAAAVHYSKYYLHRMFTETVGMTIHDYVSRRQLTEAAKLLVFSKKSMQSMKLKENKTMELEKSLNEYLEKIEKYLKPLTVSERVDIVKEIKSEMLELQASGTSAEQIIERLGNPKELAKAYLGEAIVKNSGFSWRRLSAVIAFYSLAGIGGMFVLPITSIGAITFMASGVLCPIAGIIKLVAHFLGYEITEIGVNIGTYSASAIEFFPISILIGVVSFIIGWLLWKLTVVIIKSLSKGKKKLDQ